MSPYMISDVVIMPDVGNCICNFELFDPTICNNSRVVREVLRLVKSIVEALHMFMDILRGGQEGRVKGYSTREMINYPWTRREERIYYKLHSAISLSILQQFSWSQWHPKALEKTFWSISVMSRGNQQWPRYQADQQVTTMVLFIKSPIS